MQATSIIYSQILLSQTQWDQGYPTNQDIEGKILQEYGVGTSKSLRHIQGTSVFEIMKFNCNFKT